MRNRALPYAWAFVVLALIASLTACGGGPTGPDQPGPVPPFVLTVTPQTQTFGGNANFKLKTGGCVQGGAVEFHIFLPPGSDPVKFVQPSPCSNWERDTNTYSAETGISGFIPVGEFRAQAIQVSPDRKESNIVTFTVLPAP